MGFWDARNKLAGKCNAAQPYFPPSFDWCSGTRLPSGLAALMHPQRLIDDKRRGRELASALGSAVSALQATRPVYGLERTLSRWWNMLRIRDFTGFGFVRVRCADDGWDGSMMRCWVRDVQRAYSSWMYKARSDEIRDNVGCVGW